LPTVVRKKAGQSDDKLIADFRKKVISDENLIELKQREFYRKPSIIKQEKIKERRRGRRRPVISYQNKK
jgi:ribosomal protein S21